MPPTRIIKFGGSLLDAPTVLHRLPTWIAAQPAMHNVWIVGGGKLVDALRVLHQQFELEEAASHWMAVDLLKVTARVFAQQFPDWALDRSMPDLQQCCRQQEPSESIFDCGQWLRSQTSVPESWDVTTDSIAALVAAKLDASELVLLKSTDPPSSWRTQHYRGLSEAGFCDAYFPTAAASVNAVRIVNFRQCP